MTKGIGPKCNLDCQYCFYLEKEALFAPNERYKMSDETLERFVSSYIAAQPGDTASFAWQGGEPTLLGVSFFEKVVALQAKHARGKRIENAFQTNGTLLDDRWADFLAKNEFLVGVSIDGPRELHDAYRVKRNGKGSFDEVLRGIRVLQRHGVQWNSLTCVNRINASKPLEVYKFLKGIGSRYMQFIPIVERQPNSAAQRLGLGLSTPPSLSEEEAIEAVTPWSVIPREYGSFLSKIFDRWVHHDVGKIYVQTFEVSFTKWLGIKQGLCIFNETCGDAVALEHDGSVYSCDHFVYPDYRLGNINEDSLPEMIDSPFQRKFGLDKLSTLPSQCRQCDYRFACNGGCPKQRFTRDKANDAGLNYLCPGYFAFFRHADPYYRVMASLYRRQQSPALIMELLKKKKIPGLN